MSTKFTSQQFINLALQNQVLRFGEFELKSGRISPYFFNAGLLADGTMLSTLANGYAAALTQLLNADDKHTDGQNRLTDTVLFGAAYKGIPFVAATAQALWTNHHINMAWGYNRKEVKDHGEGGQLVGASVKNKQVWIIDDVITAGTAIREVVGLLTQAEANIAGILVALDRKEKGNSDLSAIQELQNSLQVPVKALVDIDDIINYVKIHGDNMQLAKMQQYRTQYGV